MAFDFLKKWKRKAQTSARQGYKSYKSDQQKQRKKKVVTSNYDQARQKQKPTQSGGSSSRYSNNRSASRSGGTAQHRGVQNQQRRPQPEKKKHQNTWQEHVQKTLDTKKNKTQNSALEAYKKMKDTDANALGAKSKTRVVNTSQGNLKSRDLNREEYLKLQNASRIGGKVGTRSLGKDLAEKVGSRTAYSAKKGKVATGIMQGMAYGDVLEGGVGTYNKKARAAVEDVKKSTAYNLGYGAGQMAGFALSGTSSAARALASGGAKAAGKAAAKAGAKQAAKTAAKSTAKTTGKKVGEDLVKESAKKAAETAGKKSAKKFIKNRAIESAVESPMNMVDAVKMSRDENGKINKKKLAGYMALNTGLTAGAGGMMEGAAMKFTKNEGKKLIALQAKANKGGLTEKEGQTLQKLYSKLDTARKDTASAKSDLAAESFRKGKGMEEEAKINKLMKPAQEAKDKAARIKNYNDIKAMETARQEAKANKAADEFVATPEGQRAVVDPRVNAIDERIQKLRNSSGSKKKKLQDKKEAARLERERDKLVRDTKADVTARQYKVTTEEYQTVQTRIHQDEAVLENLKRRQGYSKNPNSKGYAKRQKAIDNLQARIDNDKEALSKYTVSNEPVGKQVSDPIVPKKQNGTAEAPNEVKTAPKEEPTAEAPKTKAETEANAKTEANPKVKEEAKTTEQKVSEMETYSATDKSFKNSAKNIVKNAPDQAEKVDKLHAEYMKKGKEIAANKKKAQNSKTPEHIEEYKQNIKKLEEEQKKLDNDIKKIEDTYVSRHEDGKEVMDTIEPTDPKKSKRKKGGFFDKIETFRRLTESSLIEFETAAKKSGDNALLSATNNVITARNRAGAFITTARSSFKDRSITGKSLNQIFKDAGAFKDKGVRSDFNTYALLLHHIDRAKKGKPVFMEDGKTLSIPDAQKAIESLEKKYDAVYGVGKGKEKLEQFSQDLTDYSNDLLKYRLDAGLITKDAYEATLRDYPHYVPTYRITEGDGAFVFNDAGGAELKNVLRGAKGGEEPIEDLYSQLYKITNDVITNAEQNEMVKLYAKDMGFDPKQLGKEVDLEDLEKARIKAGNGTISYFVDGQRVTLPANEQAIKGLREWNGQDYATFCNACNKIGKISGIKIFKGLITDWNIAFGVRNGARDIQQAVVNSKDTRWFAWSLPSSIHALAHKNNAYRKLYEANGGKYYVPSGDPRVMKDPTKMNAFDKIVAPAEAINSAIECTPRMTEFIGTINKEANKILKGQGKSLKDLRAEAKEYVEKNMKDLDGAAKNDAIEDKYAEMVCKLVGKDTVDRAMRNSADITLNFSRKGAIVKGLNAGAVPYLNPSVQGLSKTMRLFSEGHADKVLLNLGAKLGVMTIAPAMFNEFMLKDNQDYQDLNTRDKDTNFFIPIGDGKFIKIPKPRENAALSEPFTYGLRYYFDKAQVGSIAPGEYSSPDNWKQMFKSVWDNIGPINPVTSNYASPIINTLRNKTWYGGNIESASDQKLPVNERGDETTSALALTVANSKALNAFAESNFSQNNAIGKLIASNLSPKKIDNLFDSYWGMIYDVAIKPTAANRDMGNVKDNLGNYLVGQFVLDGVYSNKLATGFYDKLDKLNKGAKDGEYTYKGKVYMNEYGNDVSNYSTARSVIFKDDKDFNKFTPKERQEIAREMKRNQNDVFRSGMRGEEGVFGTFENNFSKDSFRIMAKVMAKAGFEKKTGKMPEEKILQDFTYTNENGKNMYRDAFDKFKESEEYKKAGKRSGVKLFFNDTIRTRGLLGEAGAGKSFPTWTAVSLVAEERRRKTGDDSHLQFAKAYGASNDVMTEAKNYQDYDYTLQNYAKTHKTLEHMAIKEKDYLSNIDDNKKTIALANKKYSDGAFYIEGKYVDRKQNFARCIAHNGVTSKEYNKWMDKYDLHSYVKGKSKEENYGKSSKDEVINAIEKDYGKRSNEFKAAMYRMFYDWGENPYGEVGDYSQKNDRGLHHAEDSYGGWGRRRRRRGWGRRRRHGRGGGGDAALTNASTWEDFVAGMTPKEEKKKTEKKAASAPASVKINPSSPVKANKVNVSKAYNSKIVNANKVKASKAVSSKVHFTDNTKRSELTEAYIKRQQRRLKKSRG